MARILIIEDNATNRQLMVYLLRAFGHSTEEAVDGEDGIRQCGSMPDLVLCDVQLPGIDGSEVARYLKSHPAYRRIPLVAVTALAMVGDRERLLEAGFNGYLPKPIEPETFVSQVERFLTRTSGITSAHAVASSGKLDGCELAATAGSGAKVLVVDNRAVNLELARSILEPFGYLVITARSPADGLAAAREHGCDLILSDVCMGRESGFDLLRAVRENSGLRNVPFVFISSTYTDDADRDQALALGADRFLVRPIEPEALLCEIAACLKERPDR